MTTLPLHHLHIAVTGGGGFLGGHVVDALLTMNRVPRVTVIRKSDYDLRDKHAIRKMYESLKPDIVIHLAAVVGGIGANRDNPGKFLYENLVMGTELIEEGRRYGALKKFVAVGTICSYPKFTPVPFREDDLWNGYPEETNAPYGLAKKMMLAQIQAYAAQYGFPGIFLLPVNLYGPRDNFELHSSHVIPALIRKIDAAMVNNDDEVTLWGDGTPTREFIHARDAARAIVMATETYDGLEPVNVGTGAEMSIHDLAHLIKKHMGFSGTFRWDTTKPNGQPRRMLDVTRAHAEFGFRAEIGFDDGIKETIAWWRAHRDQVIVAENNVDKAP